MLHILTAVRFARFMDSGKTKPAILACEDSSGDSVGEYVVKLCGGMESRESGLLSEYLAAKLADYFGIATPPPALVRIERDLAELISLAEPHHKARLLHSIGLNFGSKLVTGYSIWPVNKQISESNRRIAAEVFAFDALLQNPDRRFDNPNLFFNGENILIFDHEMAFSFLLDITPSATPWNIETQTYLQKHAFYRTLKSHPIDLEGFIQNLRDLSDTVLESVMAGFPVEWNNGNVPKIFQHIRSIRDHISDFEDGIRRFLV